MTELAPVREAGPRDAILHILMKLSSGRWLVTVAAAIVFVYTAIKGILPPDDVKMILGIVITFYFTKNGASS